MSTLFECSVASVKGAVVRFHYQVVHPDQWSVPGTKNFALQALVDAYWHARMGYVYGDQPLPTDELKGKALGSARVAELETLLELAHGKKVPISEAEYAQLQAGVGREGLSGWGASGNAHHKHYPTDYDRFCREAEKLISWVKLENEVGNPKSVENDPDPSADLVFELHDPAFLDILVEGTHWDNANYDYEYYRTVWDSHELATGTARGPDFATKSATYDVFDGEQEAGTPENCAFSADGQTLVFASQMAELVAYRGGKEVWRRVTDHMFGQFGVVGDVACISDSGENPRAFRLSDGEPAEAPKVVGRATSTTGRYAGNYGDDECFVFSDGREVEAPDVVEGAAFSRDEKHLALAGMFDGVLIVDPETGTTRQTLASKGRGGSVSFSPDGSLLAVAVEHKFVEVYRLSDGKRLTRMGGKHYLGGMDWDPTDGSLVVAHITDSNGYDGHFVRYPMLG